MNRFLLALCLIVALLATLTPCVAATTPANGVIAQERVITLPQDQGKWYVSVVGDPQDARFKEIASWFETNPNLLKLRNSTQFCVVMGDSAIFNERYAPNTPALPMIRVQNAEGVVYSQLCEDEIPLTAEGLSAQIADEVNSGPKTGCLLRPIREWRKKHYLPTIQPNPRPAPVVPVIPDIRPGPIGPMLPIIEPVLPSQQGFPFWLLAPICLVSFTVGAVAGAVRVMAPIWRGDRK